MKLLNILYVLTFCLVGSATAQKSSSWMTGFNSLWNLISDTTRRSIDGVTKTSGIDLFGKNGLLTKTIMKPTPPALYDMPPQDYPPTEPNYVDFGHGPTLPPDMLIQRDPQKMILAAKRAHIPQFTCSKEYAALPGHTMCMNDNPNVAESGISELDKVLVLRHHNRLRGQVQPPATDLVKLKWDDRLAVVAQKWANQCEAGHDKERNIPSIGMTIGQNVAGGYRSWKKAVQMWYDEITMWKYGIEPDSYLGHEGWKKIGHFTQMVQNGTYLVGCGYAVCKNSMYKRYYVCDYAAGQSNLAIPYTSGPRCSKCPHSCSNGQCDCKGIVCYNGGKLDPDSCQCQCTKVYKGRTCEELNCPAEDAFVCGRDWPQSYCERFYNVPDECPYMCGRCKGGSTSALKPPTTYTSAFGCTFKGRRASHTECSKYGDHGQDIQNCATQGGNVGCSDCATYYNVKRDMCPVMCGLCDAPCGGKMCQNGGSLNTATCTCTCVPPYSGSTCAKAKCPAQDAAHCKWWPKSHCRTYYNVPQECPRMCGIC